MARRAVEHPVVRTRLLEAARQLMLRDGFPATGVAEICAAAGVTKGFFFHYFAGVDEFAVRPRRCDPIGVYALAGDVISFDILRVGDVYELGTDPLAELETAIDGLGSSRTARRTDVVAGNHLAEAPL